MKYDINDFIGVFDDVFEKEYFKTELFFVFKPSLRLGIIA